MQNRYVYIGILRDGRFYVGVSDQEPKALLREHRSGKHSRCTRAKGLSRIEWRETHASLASARRREKQLKRWSHAKKEALIHGDLARLKRPLRIGRVKALPPPLRHARSSGFPRPKTVQDAFRTWAGRDSSCVLPS
ncbi:MAG: GIY-YIG nuclease family protein [Planctomycetes bacterium]|nr:GIY-YIG nuclease family protein [Planctomycetota bacterium]